MITLDVPPKLILPDHYQANRPAIIRPVGDLANFFPFEIDRETRRAIVSKLAKLGAADDRAKASKLIEAAIPFGMFAPSSLATITYATSAVSIANATVYTFASTSIGTAAANRRLVIAVSNQAASVIATTFVKVNTVEAVKLVGQTQQNVPNGAGASAELWIIDQPTGATASIEVTYASGTLRCGIAVWAVYGLNSNTPTDTAVDSGTTTGRTASIDCNAGGVVIGLVSGSGSGAVRTHTWTGITENFDQVIEGQGAHSGASLGFSTAQVGLSVTTTASGAVSTDILVVAALR